MIRSHQLRNVVNVVHNSFPADVRNLPLGSSLLLHFRHLAAETLLIVSTFLFELIKHRNNATGYLLGRRPIRLINKAFLIVDLNHAALRSKSLDHAVAHIAWMIAKRAARR